MDERLHNGGAMAFGNDGQLYITLGDAGKRANANPLDNVHGSIIRINEDGSVPADNPYTNASGFDNSYRCADTKGRVPTDAPDNSVCAEVWANGLRNPFRIDMDPSVKDKVKFSFGVVGAQHIEAIYYGGTDYKGTNYGWPKYEGVCRPGQMTDCNALDDDPTITMPFHWYEHISYDDGGCIGGQVHVPEGIWPPAFKYLFIDFILLKIYSLEENRPDRACWDCNPPLPPTRNETFYRSIQAEGRNINEARMVEMWFGPYKDTQALYVTKFGNHNTVMRIRYTGILNKPPTPFFGYRYDGEVSVTFDASNTTDPENDNLSYTWDFGDETEAVNDQTIVSHQYSQPGEYTVTLMVTDTSGQEQQVSKTIKVGTIPSAFILSPPPNTTFAVGQVLRLKGKAFDFLGNPIPDDKLTWEVRQHHANHFHPFLDHTAGNDFDLYAAPKPEDYFAATNSFLKVILTAEDEYGLTETVSVDVQPNTIMVNITTQPSGLDVIIDGYDVESPELVTSWKGYKLPVTVVDQPPYMFKKWSDERTARTRVFQIYQKDGAPIPQVRAIFCGNFGTQCDSNTDCCSGYCSSGMNNMCAPVPMTESPTSEPTSPTYLRPSSTYAEVPHTPASELEINVAVPPTDNKRPPLLIDPRESEKTSVSIGLTDNGGDSNINVEEKSGMNSTQKWILSLSIVLMVMGLGWCVLTRTMYGKDMDYIESVTQSIYHKRYYDDESEGARSNNSGADEFYYDGTAKATGTGSTEETEVCYHGEGSPVSKDEDKSDISTPFLVSDSIVLGESNYIDDIEDQTNVAADIESCRDTISPARSCSMPPLSPASSMKNPELNDYSETEKEKVEIDKMLEYRFDAASTSQSSLAPTPLSDTLDQPSFNEILEEGSVDISIPSPEKSIIELAVDSSTIRNLVENSPKAKEVPEPPFTFLISGLVESEESYSYDVTESIDLDYVSEKSVTHEEFEMPQKNDEGAITLPTLLSDENQSQAHVEEVDRVLDLLLVDYSGLEESFIKKCADRQNVLSPENGSEANQNAEVSNEGRDEDINESDLVNSTKLEEQQPSGNASISSQISNNSSTPDKIECTSKSPEFAINSITHVNNGSNYEVDLSPLKSPTLQRKIQTTTGDANFMSPEVYHQQHPEKETPETLNLSYDDRDSSLDNSTSFDMSEPQTTPSFSSNKPSTALNLESSFTASARHNNAQHRRKEANTNVFESNLLEFTMDDKTTTQQ